MSRSDYTAKGPGYLIQRGPDTLSLPGEIERYVLGLDPGVVTGWAVLDPEAPKGRQLVYAGVLDSKDDLRAFTWLERKSHQIATYAGSIAMEQSFQSDRFLSESGAKSIQLRGAIKAGIERAEMDYTEIHPMTARKSLGIKGKMSDAELRRLICSYLGLPEKFRLGGVGRELIVPSHIIDACAVAWAYSLQNEALK